MAHRPFRLVHNRLRWRAIRLAVLFALRHQSLTGMRQTTRRLGSRVPCIPPGCPALTGHIERQFQSGPHTQFVKRGSQIIFYYLLGGSNNRGNLPIGESFPNQGSDLHFFYCQALTGLHACSLRNIAVASFTRLRPSRIPALRNNVRRCCLTVRGLMCNSSAISRLLHPWTRSLRTSVSRRVILI